MQNKTAAAIQAEIDFMRRMYAARMNENQPRRDRMIGYCLLAVALGVPVIAALIIIL